MRVRTRRKVLVWAAFAACVVMMAAPDAGAFIIFNEILADPPAGLAGDANKDGVRSSTDDEFVELVNTRAVDEDISGWFLADATATRHIFPAQSVVSPYSFLVIFGGGNPAAADPRWQKASTGTLSLNNLGDTLRLFDSGGLLRAEAVYGSIADQDQSITLFPDGTGTEFFRHTTLAQAQGALFSPGMTLDAKGALLPLEGESTGEEPVSTSAVPEWPVFFQFGLGWAALLLRRMGVRFALVG